jgi:FAD dependent oxidoreductase TIGR03364
MTDLSGRCYDLVVVGAGVVGLASAYEAVQRGLKVAVVERNARCVGASIRNFGFVTVTGQRRGQHWERARLTRDIWLDVAQRAGIKVVHQGLYVVAQREQAETVLQAFMDTEMGEQCRWLGKQARDTALPYIKNARAVMYSPFECRVESRDAIGQLAAWLEQVHSVDFFWKVAVTDIDLPTVQTSAGRLRASYCIACPGHDLYSLFPHLQMQAGIRLSTLQMLRVRPKTAIKLPGAIMSDLSLVRYEGYAALTPATALKQQIEIEQPECMAHGVHLIAVQSVDGSLVVGDSHVYGEAEDPFAPDSVERLILGELDRVMAIPEREVVQRWVGTYASADDVVHQISPMPGVAVGIVTGGTGASTAFAFGRELVDSVL